MTLTLTLTKAIIVTISPEGKPKIEAQGYAGTSCKEATGFLEQALGQTVSDETTSEYFLNTNEITFTQTISQSQ